MLCSVETAARSFDFFRDTFAFRNELFWEYLIDEKTGAVTTRKNAPPPTYAHHCFVLVRAAKQFSIHAQFDPSQTQLSAADYARRIREVLGRHLAKPSADPDRVLFPGFEGLREFSAAHERILKENLGGSWQSYVNRRHWRMFCPFTRNSIISEANHLVSQVRKGRTPVVHVFRFPQLTINHAVLIFRFEKGNNAVTFQTYDPNLPAGPSTLQYFEDNPRFELPRNIYWAGGVVKVYETFTGTKYSRPS
jgi:hypothetical protein